jgi:hypothetical protein
MKVLCRGTRTAIGMVALCMAVPATAQENLDLGKSPAQLFAANCAVCHKSPQGLAKAGGLLGLDSFLREHYTASKESASALAGYLKSMEPAPGGPGRATKRNAKGDDKTKPDGMKKTGAKPGDAKGTEKKPDATAVEPKSPESSPPESKPAEAKTSEPKPADAKPADAKPAEVKPNAPPAAGDARPADIIKPEKSD